ncbi:MAG: 50S ribosomal protein L29 [Bacilli bacterium]|jgi:large subunit ribosomal protein L29|nr:50S ribosomal protein L29 [Bacilli bacterium]MDY0063933.1 50S ribosomal protein L29 [Bacilli bacterium]
MPKKKVEEVKVINKESEADKIRKMDAATIEKTILELKQELFNLRFQAAVGKLENTAQINKNKKQIARMKTILTERANALK